MRARKNHRGEEGGLFLAPERLGRRVLGEGSCRPKPCLQDLRIGGRGPVDVDEVLGAVGGAGVVQVLAKVIRGHEDAAVGEEEWDEICLHGIPRWVPYGHG